jgi:hypothetical protein
MIKTTLKHWIYELCINELFDEVKRNFEIKPFLKIKINDRLSYIKIHIDGDIKSSTIFYNCIIKDITERLIKFSYNKYISQYGNKKHVANIPLDNWILLKNDIVEYKMQ